MKSDPIDIARQNIVETRNLLESLILSSEQFDYPKAKAALKKLQKKVRDLSQLEARFKSESPARLRPANVCVVDFAAPRQAHGK